MSGLSCSMDLMHNLYLGWLQYFYGSTVTIIIEDCLPNSPLQNLAYVSAFIKDYQKNQKRKFKQRLHKLTMVQPKKGYPKMRGRAADMQSLHDALLALFTEVMDETNTQHRRIRLFLELNKQVQDSLDEFSPTFGFMAVPEEEASAIFRKGLTMAQLHVMLFEHFKSEERKIFNLTPKTHFVLHSLWLSRYIHPAMLWCYKGEATMHRLQVLWKSCLPGCKHWQVGMRAALKERYLLWLKGKV